MKCPNCHYVWEPAKGKPRTTGRGSQWNHIVGHAITMGEYQGLTWRESLIDTCLDAVTKGYPLKTTKRGRVIPKDYKEMTRQEAYWVIEQYHENATFAGVRLIEKKWEEGET